MISLTSTVTDAMQSRQGRPCVRVVVMDKEWRWASVLRTEGSILQTAAVELSDGQILRARVATGGKMYVQVVSTPGTGSSWQSPWTEVAADALATSDVALSRRPGLDDIRLFWVSLDEGTYYLRCKESSDDGESWDEDWSEVCSSATLIGSLAAAHNRIFYVRDLEARVRGQAWTGGAWTGEETWAACGALAEDSGLSAVYYDGSYYLVVCAKWGDDRRLRTGTYRTVEGFSASMVDVVPPGLPAADFRPRWPSLIEQDGTWHLCYLDTYAGTPAYYVPVVIRCSDWTHWGCACGLNLSWTTMKRAVLVYSSETGALYAAMQSDVVGAEVYDASDSGRKMTETEVLFYQKDVGKGYGYVFVDIHNPGHKYDEFGEAGKDGEAIKLLAQVVVERGYRTSDGYEYVAGSPFYLVKVSHRVGIGRPALRLMAVDGWGLMGRWEIDQSYHWSGKTVKWLVAEIVARSSGLECGFDASTEWNTVIDEFSLNPAGWKGMLRVETKEKDTDISAAGWSGTAIHAVNSLFLKVGGRAYWDVNGKLQCVIPANQSTIASYTYGTNSEIIKGEYAVGVVTPNVIRVIGAGTGYQVAQLSSGQDLGRRLMDIAVDLHLDTWEECMAMATGLWDDAVARGYDGYLEVHLNPGVELWDIIGVTDARSSYSSEKRRVAGVYEVWNSVKRRYSTLLRLEGV